MNDNHRLRTTTPPRLAVIITATLLGGMIAAVGVVGSNAIELPLTETAQAALRDAGIAGVGVRFDGREAVLTSAGASGADLADAERLVEALDGVRWVTVVEADPATLPTLSVTQDPGGVVTIAGTVGTEDEASAFEEAAIAAFGDGTAVELVVVDGVAPAIWAARVPELFAALGEVEQVSFALASSGATLTGAAVDPPTAQAAVEAALDSIPLQATLSQAGPTADETAAINGTVILFVADSVTLDPAARRRVDDLAELLVRYPSVRVTLTGHIAIPVGSEAEAVRFSERRAQAVADALVAGGVDVARIDVVGAGSSRPVGDNGTQAGAAANRRVTVLIMVGS
jgi:outer membrane protein OmpA-like peptidoglycan-associated protein